jgi:hypothetical protein
MRCFLASLSVERDYASGAGTHRKRLRLIDEDGLCRDVFGIKMETVRGPAKEL